MTENIFTFILFGIGILLIVKGGDLFVDSASFIAEVSGVPKFIIGATIVSLATTMPEMLVSALAAYDSRFLTGTMADDKVLMAIGNAVGSVTCNIGMILAISILFMPSIIERKKFLPKAILLIISIISLTLLCLSGTLTIQKSIVLLILFIIFIAENIKGAKSEMQNIPSMHSATKTDIVKKVVLLIIGAAAIVIGSELLVDKGSVIAKMLGVSEKIIGFTAIAIGTSLPELVTTVSSLIKKEPSLGVGNIIGANIIDIALILPVCAMIKGGSLPVEATTARLDIPICLLVTCIALLPPIFTKKFMKWQGAAMLTVYISYLIYTCLA
ncbi:MAG: calcium/sodium antiporter [Clostridiales bacterium]|nr:calcium/sodium antiporter [Clostridiales bacterium]